MEAREHAERLVKYFENISREYGESDVWQKGLNTAQEWLRLIDTSDVSQNEIAKFMGIVHANRYRSSGWYDLARGSYHWASSKNVTLLPPKEFFASEKLPSTTFESVTYQEHALILINHFESYANEDPENLAWSLGLEAAKEWKRLLELPIVSETDVSALVELLENRKKYLSQVWYDIALGVYCWFKSCGFAQLIPSDAPKSVFQ